MKKIVSLLLILSIVCSALVLSSCSVEQKLEIKKVKAAIINVSEKSNGVLAIGVTAKYYGKTHNAQIIVKGKLISESGKEYIQKTTDSSDFVVPASATDMSVKIKNGDTVHIFAEFELPIDDGVYSFTGEYNGIQISVPNAVSIVSGEVVQQ